MAWEDVALIEVGDVRLSSQEDSHSQSWLSTTIAPWSFSDGRSEEEERFDAEGDRKEFEMAQRRQNRTGVVPVRFPTHITKLKPRSSPGEGDLGLFPAYEEPTRRNIRDDRISRINDSAFCESDDMMPKETVDDTYLRLPPSRHVDYLTHDWNENDICASWRKIVADRQGPNNLQPRLENASWRTWAKTRSRLSTLPAESINWTKDEDVTWLYGPLHSATPWHHASMCELDSSTASLKSSLKTPCLESILLHRSLSDLALVRPNLSSMNTSQMPSRSPSPQLSLNLSCTIHLSPSKPKTVSFHEEVSQCIAVIHKPLLEEQSTWTGAGFYSLFKPSSASLDQADNESERLSKTIELLAPTSLKPEAISISPKPKPKPMAENAKSWPSRTLSYFLDSESTPTPSKLSISKDSQYLSPPVESRSYFDDEDEEEEDEDEADEESESHWNPPRPRNLTTGISKNSYLAQDHEVDGSLLSISQQQSHTLSDEELFESEMFGFPLAKPQTYTNLEDEPETQSARSSPSISEYLSSSSEDTEETEANGTICASTESGNDLHISWTKHDFDTTDDIDIYSQRSDSLGLGLGFIGATATASFTSLLNRFEQASSTVVSSVTKDLNFATTCSSEYNSIYRSNHHFAVKKPAAPEFGGSDDEEHWWINV